MGFFYNEEKKKAQASKKPKRQDLSRIPKGLLREQGCKVCALNHDGDGSIVPPSGDKAPLLYVLGEMPGPREVQTGIHFKGESGSILRRSLRDAFPELFESKRDLTKTADIRFNYCVQCPTPKHAQPRESEIECCRKGIEKDIEKSKPFAIIGLGPLTLKWFIGYSNIDEWRGRRIPVKVGSHTCWYFPVQTPALLRKKSGAKYKNEHERAFDIDLARAANFIMDANSPEAKVYTSGFEDGIKIYLGRGPSEVKKIEKALEALKFESSISLDIETDRLKPYGVKDAKIVTISIGTFDNTIAFPLDHPEAWKGDEKSRKRVRDLVNDFMLTARGVKAPHNLKFEAIWLNYYYGQKCLRSGNWGDTMAQAYTLDNRTKKKRNCGMLGIGVLTTIYFGFNLKALADINVKKILSEPLDRVLLYNGRDVKWQHKTYLVQDELLEDSQRWTYEHLCRTGISFAITESDGVPVDDDTVVGLYDDYTDKIEEIEGKIEALPSVKKFERLYGNFTASKGDNVILLFKEVLGLTSIKETEKGKYSTDDEVLKIFSGKGHIEADLISNYREAAKLKSTYIDPLMRDNKDRVLFPDLCLHADYNHLFTSTGRTSSENPNMQNFPKRKNKEIRTVVAAPEGYYVVAVDYGQLEARIIAMASQDKNFCESLRTGYDIHREWGERIIRLHPACAGVRNISELDEDALDKFRGRTKNEWVFPLFFGSHFTSVASSLGLPLDKAERIVKEFWGEFTGVAKWQKKMVKFYNKHGYVETLTGARRQGPLSYNELINAPIQGTGSYVVNDGQARLSLYAYKEKQPQFQPRMNIHDDLTFFIPEVSLEEDIDIISEKMCCTDFDFINVPLAVEIEVGNNWADTEAVMTLDTTDFK